MSRPKPGREPLFLPRPRPKNLPPRVRELVELMVWGYNGGQPMSLAQAAAVMGISHHTARDYFRREGRHAYHNALLAELRESERARNLRAAIDIRDDAEMSRSAAGNRARLEAARFIEGEPAPAGININVGVGVNVQPGYVIDVSPHRVAAEEILRKAGSKTNLLTTEDRGGRG